MMPIFKPIEELEKSKIIVVDIETFDPNLLDIGNGVYRKDGYILGVSIADDNGFAEYYNLGHYDCRESERDEAIAYLRKVLAIDCPKLGTNILYDIDWLENWTGDEAKFKLRGKAPQFRVNGMLYDIQVAEPLLDENQGHYSLDFQAKKYLGVGKLQDVTQKFCDENGLKGDPRKWLWKMPYSLVREYAMGDVTEPLQIFNIQLKELEKQNMLELLDMETRLSRAILHMRKTGVRIDVKKRNLNAYMATVEKEKREITFEQKYGNVNLNSTAQLARLFEKIGVEYNYKITYIDHKGEKRTSQLTYKDGKTVLSYIGGNRDRETVDVANRATSNCPDNIRLCNPSIDKDCLEALEQEYEDSEEDGTVEDSTLTDILFIRKAQRIINGFLQGSMVKNLSSDGRIHADINPVRTDSGGTRTGRFSVSKPNLQQLPSPSRNKYWGTLCRECFIPEDNCWWGKIDYSQIEYRILAHFASGEGSEELREKFRNDPHTDYHQYIVDLTGLSRSFAKNLNFGCMYGMGKKKMSNFFQWTMDYATEVLDVYHGNAPYIKYTMNKVSSVAKIRGYVRTIAGRHAHLVDDTKAYKMLNSLIQGTAADVAKKSMIDTYESDVLDTLFWHIPVHDELNFSIPKTAKGLRKFIETQSILEAVYKLKVPIRADAEIGINWGNLHHVDFLDIDIDKQEWLDGLTDENCKRELQRVIDACEIVEAEKERKKKEAKMKETV